MTPNRSAQVIWAGRELLRHPGTTLLIALCLGLLTALIATGLLLSQALTATTHRILLSQGPDLVVRRLNPTGWQPISEQATALALAIPGIIDAYPRVWGTAQAPQGIVTAVAMDSQTIQRLKVPLPIKAPNPGEALVGRGVRIPETPALLKLHSVNDILVRVVQRFPPEVDLVTHDLVMLHPHDARKLFGLPAGAVSDLALMVFHPAEATAVVPELSRAFPWPVHIATRQETLKHYAASFGRRGGLGLLLYLPAAMALILLVTGVIRQQIGGRARVGLLKALGWTSRDIVTHQITKALVVALPAIALGLMIAYGLVYAPVRHWSGYLLLGWQDTAPLLNLDAGHAAPIFIEVAGMVLIPFLAAVLWSSLVQAAADPQDLLNEGG